MERDHGWTQVYITSAISGHFWWFSSPKPNPTVCDGSAFSKDRSYGSFPRRLRISTSTSGDGSDLAEPSGPAVGGLARIGRAGRGAPAQTTELTAVVGDASACGLGLVP